MATFAEAKGHNKDNIRKILEMAIFVRPKPVAPATDEPVLKVWSKAPAAGLTIPTGFMPVGLTTKDDGATWTRTQETSDTTSHGYSQPTRRDVTSDVRGLSFTAQESKRTTMELYNDVDLSGITPDADGNLVFDQPSRPTGRRWQVLAIGKDGDGPNAVYVARILPDAQVTEMPEQSWVEGTELRWPCRVTGYVNEGWGTSYREIWGGPGLRHVDMGFPAPPA